MEHNATVCWSSGEYSDTQCCARHEGKQTDWFNVDAGVKQGYASWQASCLFLILTT